MNRLVMILIGIFCLPSWAFAADLKIAVVDQFAALLKSKEAQGMVDSLKADLSDDQNELRKITDSIRAQQEKLKKDGAIMSESQKSKLQKEIEDKRIDYNFLGQKIQKRGNEGQQDIIKALAPKFDQALNAVVKKKKIDVVLQRQAVLYTADAIDITELVTQQLNTLR